MTEPIQYSTGIISSIQWDKVIEAILSRDRAYIDSLEQKIEENNTKLTAWGSISARVLTVQNYATVLSKPSTFQATDATSTNEDILTAEVSEDARVGRYPLTVYQLAQNHQLTSRGFQDPQNNIASTGDTVSIEVGEGWVNRETSLEWLNSQSGVNGGSIKITDRSGNSAVIDLKGTLTVQDVIDAINENSVVKVSVQIDYDAGYNTGDAIKLIDTSGGSGNLIVEEVNGGGTAQDLGIYTGSTGVAADTIHGEDINSISWETSLDLLNDKTGVDEGSIRITDRVGNVDTIDLSSATTLQDVKNLIEAGPNTNVEVQINSDTNGITIHDLNASPTQDLIIEEVNGTTAHDLGIHTTGVAGDRVGDRIISGLNTILLKTLNGGSGVSSVTGDDFQIQARDGSTYNVDISGAQTLQEVINLINSATGSAVTASYDREGNGLLLTDTTGSTGNNLAVTAVNSSGAASDLGIQKSISSSILEGNDLNPQYIARCTNLDNLNGGGGVNTGRIKITDRSGESSKIDLSGAKTIADVIDAINGASTINVTASINSNGNGILLTDNTGKTSSSFKVEDIEGTTARDLNILKSTSTNTIDGSFEITVELTSEETTLEGIQDAINSADVPVNASLINDGSEINPYHLVVSSGRSGEVGRMIVDPDFTGEEALELTSTVSAQNAVAILGEGTENTVLVTGASNQLKEAIPGVTLTLKEANPDETVYVDVRADKESIKKSIVNLIDAYNSLVDAINTQQKYNPDTEKRGGPLFGSISLTNIRNGLHRALTNPVEESTTFQSIFDLGITADLTGHLVVDEAKLSEVLGDNLEGVRELFSLSQNVALSSSGTNPTASSTYSSDYNVESVNNGITSSDSWGSPGGGWRDGTSSDFPDYLTLTFDKIRSLNKVKIYTLDSDAYPASSYGIKDYELQYLISGGDPDNQDDWQTYTTVTENTEGVITHYLSSLSTEAIRLKINDSNDGQWSRIVEFEAYQPTGVGGRVKNYLDSITDSHTGLITHIEDSLHSQNEDYEERIEAQEKLLEMRKQSLWRKFTRMEQYIGMMQSQSSWLMQQINNLSNSGVG